MFEQTAVGHGCRDGSGLFEVLASGTEDHNAACNNTFGLLKRYILEGHLERFLPHYTTEYPVCIAATLTLLLVQGTYIQTHAPLIHLAPTVLRATINPLATVYFR